VVYGHSSLCYEAAAQEYVSVLIDIQPVYCVV